MQTQSSPTAPAIAAPPAPSAPAAPAPVVVGANTGQGTIAIPKTQAELDALRARRSELSDQLQSASGRRRDLERRLPGMDQAARAGVQQRIAFLDQRILGLESQLDVVGQQLASVPPGLAETAMPEKFLDGFDAGNATGIAVTFTIFVLAPIALAMSRFVWKRSVAPVRPPSMDAAAAQRLDRIENAVDAIAIEVERVSEGQRFLTRLFTEGRDAAAPSALGAGERPAEPVRVGRDDAVGVPRRNG